MPKLFIIPSCVSSQGSLMPDNRLNHLTYFIVEEAKTARATLKKIIPSINLQAATFFVANEHTDQRQWQDIFKAIGQHDIGLVSEAGMPCVADPGNALVLWAHHHDYEVIPLVGPSAIILALAASGLNGQQFAFHGYLPRGFDKRVAVIKGIEKDGIARNRTQIFIEAPHHNLSLFDDLINHVNPTTLICIASDLTGDKQQVVTKTAKAWQQAKVPDIDKIPTVFLMYTPPVDKK